MKKQFTCSYYTDDTRRNGLPSNVEKSLKIVKL